MGKVWDIKDVGGTEYFLGMRVQQDLDSGTICLTQRPYWEHVINCFQLDKVIPRNTPLPIGILLDNSMSPKLTLRREKWMTNHTEQYLDLSCGDSLRHAQILPFLFPS